MTDDSSSPLDSFVSRFWRDQDAGEIRPLRDYLDLFPGEDDAIAEEYLRLKRGDSPRPESSAEQIGPYHLLRELGRGGQAIVYLAKDRRLRDRTVALKVLTSSSLLGEGALERFRREAEVASKLDHPGICPVYEAGVDEAQPYIAMRYVEGATLARRIQSSRETPETEEGSLIVDLEAVIETEGPEASTDPTPTPKMEKAIEKAENDSVIRRYEKRKEQFEGQVEDLRGKIVQLLEELSAQERNPRLTERLTWELADPTDRWRHQVLSEMVRELRGFGELIEDVEERQSFAETVEQVSIGDHQAAWNRCIEGLKTNPKYAASPDLRSMKPQIGLVPLGIDRDSGLWEFWYVGAGERPGWEGADWPADPSADPRGKVQITEASGIVLVLIPGGTFWMGATREVGAQNHDPEALSDEGHVHEVTLDGFFMAKYEVTQAQWISLMGDNPSTYAAGTTNYMGGTVSPLHPVENVDWEQCGAAMRRWDLEFPTEARWEYACRAGTSTVYWCGDVVPSIQDRRAGNIADNTASEATSWDCTTEVEDGHVLHAPVGSFEANAFGLHDVLGNVWEWCEDRDSSYEQPAGPGDGLRDEPGSRDRVFRGGSFCLPAFYARSAIRLPYGPSYRVNDLGCRASRGLH